MFCPKCGAPLQESSQYCGRCGAPATAQINSASPQTGLPIGAGETNGKAIGSLIAGIFGFFFPAAIAAIFLGHISRSEIRKSNGRLRGSGMALAGLILGYAGITCIPFLIIAAIVIPNLLRARIAANEASAVASVRTINVAEISYLSAYPNVGYACALSNLGGSEQSSRSPDHARLIDSALESGTKSGYRFVLQNCANSENGRGKYQVAAYPVSRNQSGVRAFCSDQTAVIGFDNGGSPDDCLANREPLQ
jgi:type II secretory pathway pseudopilin PulG